MKFPTIGNWTTLARSNVPFLLFAGVLAVFVTLMLLGVSDVEGQTGDCYSQAADAETTLEVCLESVTDERNPGGGWQLRSRVVVNREITGADRPADTVDPDLYEKMSCTDPSVSNSTSDALACIRGGIRVFDSYFGPVPDDPNAPRLTDRLIAFAIREGEDFAPEEKLLYSLCDDGDANLKRKIKIDINPVFVPEYGYTIRDYTDRQSPPTRFWTRTITLDGDEDAGGEPCPGVTINQNLSTQITLTVSPTSVREEAGQTNLQVTGTLNGDSLSTDTVVSLSISAGSGSNAASTSDFSSGTATLTISQGQTTGTATLSFTPVDDSVPEGNENVAVTGDTSADLTVNGTTVDIIDNDIPSTQIDLTVSPISVREEAGQTNLQVTGTLNGSPQTSTTVVTLSTSPGTALASDYSSGTATLTIPANQQSGTTTLSFTPDNDAAPEDDETVQVLGETTSSGLTVIATIVTIIDNDSPGVTVSPTSLRINTGASRNYTVKLNTLPTADVTVDITAPAGTSVDKNSLTFTPGNGTTAQTVRVTAGSTTDSFTINQSATSTDADYNNINVANVAVTVSQRPTETPGIVLSPTTLTVPEGASRTYRVSLNTLPTADVAVDITAPAGISVDKNRLTFTSGNGTSAQTVAVSAGHDSDCSNDSATLARLYA